MSPYTRDSFISNGLVFKAPVTLEIELRKAKYNETRDTIKRDLIFIRLILRI